MATYIDIHPQNPQPRLIAKAVDVIRDGGLIAYPTDSGYALGCRLGNRDALERIRQIRQLDAKHDFTLVCQDWAQLDRYVLFDNSLFRVLRHATPGPYTFIMKSSHETPKAMQNPKKKTVGVRIPDHVVVQAMLVELGEPIVSSTLLLPGHDDPPHSGWQIKEDLDHQLDAVVEGEAGLDPTTVVDITSGIPEILRLGAGDPTPFE